MTAPRWLPAGVAAVAAFVSGCVVMVPANPPHAVVIPRPVVYAPPPVYVPPPKKAVFLAPPAVPSPMRPVRCARTPLGHCEVRR